MAQKKFPGVLQEDDSSSPVWRLRVGGGRTVRGPRRDGVLLPPSSPCERRPFANGRRPLPVLGPSTGLQIVIGVHLAVEVSVVDCAIV